MTVDRIVLAYGTLEGFEGTPAELHDLISLMSGTGASGGSSA